MSKKIATVAAFKRELQGNVIFYIAVLLTATLFFSAFNWEASRDLFVEFIGHYDSRTNYVPIIAVGYWGGVLIQATAAVGAWLLYVSQKKENGNTLLLLGLLLLKIYFIVFTAAIILVAIPVIFAFIAVPLILVPVVMAFALIGNYFYRFIKTLFELSRAVQRGEETFHVSAYVVGINQVVAILGLVGAGIIFIVRFFAKDFSLIREIHTLVSSVISALLLIFIAKVMNNCNKPVAIAQSQNRQDVTEGRPMQTVEKTIATSKKKREKSKTGNLVKRIIFLVVVGAYTLCYVGFSVWGMLYPQEFVKNGVIYTMNEEKTAYTVTDMYVSTVGSVERMQETKGKNVSILSNRFGVPITKIDDGAFRSTGIIAVKIPDSVVEIGDSAFSSCFNLKTVDIPESVKKIGSTAFSGCSSFTDIEIPGQIVEIGKNMFSWCRNLETVYIEDGITVIEESAFENCFSLKTIEIPDGVTSIGYKAFSNCSALESIDLPDSVTKLGDGAFFQCSNLKTIQLPNAITEISGGLFSGCASLESVSIPATVTKIGVNAFYNCKALKTVNIPDGVITIEERAFSYCEQLSEITIPGSVQELGYNAFGFSGLVNIYCGKTYQPGSWHPEWNNACSATVYWGRT